MLIDLKGRIKTVQSLVQKSKTGRKDHSYGETEFGKDWFTIRLSLALNQHLDEFASTVLHELLHVWFSLMRKVLRLKCTDAEEHKIIEAIESVVMYHTYLHLKRRKALTKGSL